MKKAMEAIRDPEHCCGEDRQQIERIENAFTYHSPKEGQPEKYAKIRAKAKALAYLIEDTVPDSREAALLQLVPQTVPDETARLNGSALYKL